MASCRIMLDENDIAGGVVVVVKDGQVLTERGFGYADIETPQAGRSRERRCSAPARSPSSSPGLR